MRKIPYTVWIVLVVFLLASNVAFIVTFRKQGRITKQQQDLLPEFVDDSLPDLNKDLVVEKEDIPSPQAVGLLIRELNLTPEQQEQFRQFHRTFNRSAHDILLHMDTIRSAMANELRASKPNKMMLDQLAEELGNKHKELKQLTFRYYFQMKEVLTTEQQTLFVDVFNNMLSDPEYRQPGPRQGFRQQGPRMGTRSKGPRYPDRSSTENRRGGKAGDTR
ncbi:MAG: periplasmic heavy metal sensor [Bacteroidales bacterium]